MLKTILMTSSSQGRLTVSLQPWGLADLTEARVDAENNLLDSPGRHPAGVVSRSELRRSEGEGGVTLLEVRWHTLEGLEERYGPPVG
jgi:hypothetical protein